MRRSEKNTTAYSPLNAKQKRDLHKRLLAFYDDKKRDLPWRRTSDPYRIWLSEVMLQQTRVETVIPYYERFLEAFPTVHRLADAPLDSVLSQWSGLGYYRRARMLHAAAGEISLEPTFPKDRDALLKVKGIGPYTAGAVASIAFGEQVPLVDGNVARVFARLFAIREDIKASSTLKVLWQIAGELVPSARAGDWNQALMELGATVCVPREPRCGECPVAKQCEARISGRERTLPVVGKKAAPKAQERTALFSSKGARVLMLRRVPNGLFGGMWELPTVEGPEAEQLLCRLVNGNLSSYSPVGEFTHVLSHRRLRVTVVHATIRGAKAWEPLGDYDASDWLRIDECETRGISRLTRKALDLLRTKGLLR